MVDQIIELENKKKYVILDSKILDDVNYYFGLRLDDKEEPTNNYLFFEEFKEDDDTYLDPVTDETLKAMLFGAFTLNFVDMVYDA